MLDHAREAVELSGGRSRNDLDTDRQFALALVRLVEIVGEAAARVPQTVRQEITDVPWQQIVGMRNRLIHGYDEVDFDILWSTVRGDLPHIVKRLSQFLSTD
jgi:uncharacterized protein with HEPN domain